MTPLPPKQTEDEVERARALIQDIEAWGLGKAVTNMSKLEDDLEEALHGVGFNHFRLCDCAPTLSDLIRAFRCAGWAPACERGEDFLTALEAAGQ